MRHVIILILAVLCLNLNVWAQQQVLETKVSLQYKEVSLERAISDIQKKYGIRFSYVNNLIPLQTKVSIDVKDQTLRAALDELLKNVEVNYYLVGDQIVLKNEPKKTSQIEPLAKPRYVSMISGLEPQAVVTQTDSNLLAVNDADMTPSSPDPSTSTLHIQLMASLLHITDQIKSDVATISQREKENREKRLANKNTKEDKTVEEKSIKAEVEPEKEKKQAPTENNDASVADSVTSEQSGYIKRPFQVSFVAPISSNGLEAGKVVNTVSLNIISGYAAGLEGVEFAGVLNMENDYVKGAQFAGVGNLVKKNVTGAQFAGVFNINGDTIHGGQFAGFVNVAARATEAAQFAGFVNVTGSAMKGAQFAGFANVNKGITGPQAAGFVNVVGGDVKGGQAAGFANVNKGTTTGPQFAGFLNYSGKKAKSAQFAGFSNITNGEHTGVQVSGFLNFAHRLKGVQLGFINVADTVDGVQIGFLSISKKGYRRLELWGSEALTANIAFKMGSRQFYNIFAVGAQTFGDEFRWGWGYGFGSELRLSRGLALNIDAIAYHINEDEVFTDDLNLLNVLRANLGVRLAGNTHLFAGPTFNVMVSDHASGNDGKLGSGIAPSWVSYNETHKDTNVKMWPGFNVGIRF
ncbi:hypothetical protein GXP67_34200 [Rhodocytophaga rosea]|uniref:Secretin/TonB short N-terminal domain-containing protein n=1 Tax=Rhodocytophaga rosea TaxID=2704465 RepID=A0A6C0GUX0_9BACT|nr:STN domain-containing protein [Rhodocytophaga rosea]QHT71353.1 hypothetical protein GXP67_34200 [Rhodocytophaga rosea]